MQTRAAEMLGVTFPICAAGHCRDAANAATDLVGHSDGGQHGERVGG
jgi:hypothetical protein